ncbi:ORF15 [Leucania separata nucleopolyhedrovirus]|uniref:ORF15 n=1 Tax=Leucania separata nucleopolyhedrovirus TaxID=1307956 RepID=Q0ILA4_NPVLS|nr:ORF15 [Leucania separata nucleopolyhedrovirus]AAR28779.1 ORF15 [Leucania separata nucleopolyhedrovirus]
MDINLYEPFRQANLISFTIADAPNCIVRMMFRYECGESAPCQDYKTTTRLVSGYEKTKRPILMNIRQVHNVKECVGNYVISCFVLPFVSLGLVQHKSFNRSINVVVVRNDARAVQVWHVLCMRKSSESASMRSIRAISFARDETTDMLDSYGKLLFCVSGNVPSRFVQYMSKNGTNVNDIDALLVAEPQLAVNNSPVLLETTQIVTNGLGPVRVD